MFRFLLSSLSLISLQLHAQHVLTGYVADEKAIPVPYATVALLHPHDSTLAFFGITNAEGRFEIKNIKAGNYLLQTACLSYQTFYKSVDLPLADGELYGTIVLKAKAVSLGEVEVSSERIPLLIRKDTIEYDAAAFKTKPDATTEDLLKKLPGVEVDRAGNVKAQGEDVKNVLVDGKEFFGSDPKVATKNLPADAVKKVQVYDKKSDDAEFTGVDDGSRSKTINLLLKDTLKSAWMGELLAGGGTDEHYQASAKAYRFTRTNQFALLGMLNNINQFGFTFKDYIDFNGGIRSLMNGDGDFRININDDNDFPVNFGQPITGLITSGAGGMNYTYEKKKDHRFNISYLGNGADKRLEQKTFTRNFTPDHPFTSDENLDQADKNYAHRLNFGWRNRMDSTQQLIVTGNAGMTRGNSTANNFSQSFSGDTLENELHSISENAGHGLNGVAHVSYLRKYTSWFTLLKIGADGSGYQSVKENEWNSLAHFFAGSSDIQNLQFQNNENTLLKYSLSVSGTAKAGQSYIVPEVKAGRSQEALERRQGIPGSSEVITDSVSGKLSTFYQWMRPGVSWRRSNDKSQFNLSVMVEAGTLKNSFDGEADENQIVLYFLPRLSWDDEYRPGHRLGFYYESGVNVPSASQLFPLPNTSDLIEVTSGNRKLKPEYEHSIRMNWMIFDQFSFTSLFISLRGTYTKDKINWLRTINEQLGQSLSLVNVSDDYRAGGEIDFSTPVRKLGINFHANPSESFNRGFNLVNGIENVNTSFTHSFTMSIDNRKKEKWDGSLGGSVAYSTARYSLQENLNNDYFNITGFAEVSYTPTTKFHFSASADVTQYNARSFEQSVTVPLVRASASYYFLKSNRCSFILDVFDLLNRNTGISRMSELNYLRETRSSIIGRYVMLTFKYRLNKFDGKGGIDVKVNGR